MKTKILLWSGVAILIAGIIAAVWWTLRPQVILLQDGTTLKLVAVTYGKHHNFPDVNSAPGVPRGGTAFDGMNDTLFVWLEQLNQSNSLPFYQLYAYDEAGTACVGNSTLTSRELRPGDELVGIRFDAFPRRDSKFFLHLQEWNRDGAIQTTKKQFVISNPAHGPFPRWTQDELPDAQADGDLLVTLTRLTAGASEPVVRNPDAPDDPVNKGVLAAFQIQQNSRTATNWQPAQVETSDATGNHVTGWCNNHWDNDEETTIYQWGLWPDEPIWKLRVEFSRTSGFEDDELWPVKNVPLQASRTQDFWNYSGRNRNNAAFAETIIGGIHLKLFPARHFTDQAGGNGQIEGGLEIVADPPPDGMRLTLLKVTDESGREIKTMNWSWGGNDYRFGLRGLGKAKSLNLTLALHRSRFVEFLVKPGKP